MRKDNDSQQTIIIASKHTLNNQSTSNTDYYFTDGAGKDYLVPQKDYDVYNVGDEYRLGQ